LNFDRLIKINLINFKDCAYFGDIFDIEGFYFLFVDDNIAEVNLMLFYIASWLG
jgi:hypothetical protein